MTFNHHASCVAVKGRGVLLLGPSGSGKTDLALRLIDRGALLVADDQVLIEPCQDGLLARPPANLAGLMEVRGVGLMRMAYQPGVILALAVTLVDARDVPRWVEPDKMDFNGIPLPHYKLCALEPSAPLKIEMALQPRSLHNGAE